MHSRSGTALRASPGRYPLPTAAVDYRTTTITSDVVSKVSVMGLWLTRPLGSLAHGQAEERRPPEARRWIPAYGDESHQYHVQRTEHPAGMGWRDQLYLRDYSHRGQQLHRLPPLVPAAFLFRARRRR